MRSARTASRIAAAFVTGRPLQLRMEQTGATAVSGLHTSPASERKPAAVADTFLTYDTLNSDVKAVRWRGCDPVVVSPRSDSPPSPHTQPQPTHTHN